MNIEQSAKVSSNGKSQNEPDAIGKVTGFFLFRNVINSYNQDKLKDEDSRREIKKYGSISLTLSIIAFVISGACLISNISRLDLVGMSYVVMLVIYILSGIVVSLILALYSFVFGVMQIRLNRKGIGIFGLIFSILDIFLCVALIVILAI